MGDWTGWPTDGDWQVAGIRFWGAKLFGVWFALTWGIEGV